MPLVSDRCICLRKIDYSETSQILQLFAREHGLVRVVAKGAHRRTKAGASKFDGGIDLLDVGQAVFSHHPDRQLDTLTEWSLQDGHLELRRRLRGLYLAQYAAELVSTLFEEHDPHPSLFERLEQTLHELAGPRLEEAFLAFELDLLREAGYLAEISVCAACGRTVDERGAAAFSPARGGVICRDCEDAIPDRIAVDPRLLRLMEMILRLPRAGGGIERMPRLTRHQTDPINRLLAEQVEHMLGKRLRLGRYVLRGS